MTLTRIQYDDIIKDGYQWDQLLCLGGLHRLKVLHDALEVRVERTRKAYIEERVRAWKEWVEQATDRGG